MNRNSFLRTWWRMLPALLWMGMIFFMSHQKGGQSGAFSRLVLEFLAGWGLDLRVWFGDHAFWVIRKMAHFTEYFILFFLMDFGLSGWKPWNKRKWWSLLGTVLYAASDEFHQLFIPGRVGDWQDVGIDSLGAGFGFVLKSLWQRLRRTRPNS